jgi:hypothetical protein
VYCDIGEVLTLVIASNMFALDGSLSLVVFSGGTCSHSEPGRDRPWICKSTR